MSDKPQIMLIICGCEGGGWHPLMPIAQKLKREGFAVWVVCDDATIAPVLETGARPICLAKHISAETYFCPSLERLQESKSEIHADTANPLSSWSSDAMDFISEQVVGSPPSLIVSSLLTQPMADALAYRYDASWCFINPSFAYGSVPACDWEKDFSPLGAQMYQHWLLPFTRRANLVLHATDPVFDRGSQHLPGDGEYLGPLFYEKMRSLPLKVSDSSSPRVLASLSTSPQPHDIEFLRTLLETAAQLHLVLDVTIAERHFPADLTITENTIVSNYLPHSLLLKNSDFLICHGGHGTVLKALLAGVPMIIIPWGRDQPGVARRAEMVGAAVVIPKGDFTVNALSRAIFEMRTNPRYRLCAKAEAKRIQSTNYFPAAFQKLKSLLP